MKRLRVVPAGVRAKTIERLSVRASVATVFLLVVSFAAIAHDPARKGRPISTQSRRLPAPEDFFAIRTVGDPVLSPDGRTIAYTITSIDRSKNSYASSIWLVQSAGGSPKELTGPGHSDSQPHWSPDGKYIAFSSDRGGHHSLCVVDVATWQVKEIAPWPGTNRFISKAGDSLSWSPDSKHIAFVAAEPDAKTPQSDPRVITRTQYKTRTSYSDDKNMHIFVASLGGEMVRELTSGNHDEHSISWSPKGDEIAFLSNYEPDPDARLNYDIFAVNVNTGAVRQLTQTPGVEYSPVWSPDGSSIVYTCTTRELTTIDSVAEDTHVWVIGRDGGTGHEITGSFDRRCFDTQWSPDSKYVYFLAGDHGRTVMYRVVREGGSPSPMMQGDLQVSSYSVSADRIAYVRSDAVSPAELYTAAVGISEGKALTDVNQKVAAGLEASKPETIHFPSFDETEIEGWLMRPIGFDSSRKYPMILSIHGGPHGMYGYSYNLSNQVLAANGYAVLYINPRGSSGYGQKFSDGCVNNWGGGDYQDLMKGVDYVLSKNSWIDPYR